MKTLSDYSIDRIINLYKIRDTQKVKLTQTIVDDLYTASDENYETDQEIKSKFKGVYYGL